MRTGDFEEWLRLQRETAARSIGTARPSAQDQMIEETLRPNEPGMEYFMGWPRHSGNVAISPRYVSICGRPTHVGKLGARVPQGKGRASGKTKAEGGQVMPELGKGTSRIHTPAPQLGSLSGGRSSHLRPPWRPVARDLLPLPLPEVMQISDDARLLSRPVRQRLLRRRAMDLRVAETVQALNFLDGHTWDPNCRPSQAQNAALHFCQQAHVNIALRTGLGRHRLLFDKTPVPLLSDTEPVVSVYVDNGGILSTQSGKANILRRQLEHKLGEVALLTHEAEAETDDLEMLGMRLHDGRAAPTRKRAWRLMLATEKLLNIGSANGVQVVSLIGYFTFVFLLRRPCLSVFSTIYQFIQSAGVRRRSLWNCVRRELRAASGLLVLAFSDLSLEVQQQVYFSDACPQGWAAHAREWPLQEVERQLAWNERWRFKWTEGQPARSPAVNSSNEQSDLDGNWAIEPDFPEIDPSLLEPSLWQLLKRGRYTYREPIHLKEARAMHFNARRAARRCLTRGRVVLMLCDNMGVVLACEKGRCTDPVLLRILRRLVAISLASGARFRYRWVPSEFCPPMKPRGGATKNRKRVIVNQNSRQSVDIRSAERHNEVAKGYVRCVGPRGPPKTILPISPTFGTSVGLGENTNSKRSYFEQTSVKATPLHTYRQHYAKWKSTPTSLEMAMIQYFDHLFFKGSPTEISRTVLATVCLCSPDWALCLRSNVGRNKKVLKGWERFAPENSKDPLWWSLVLAPALELDQDGHFEMPGATLLATDAHLCPADKGSRRGNRLAPPRQQAGTPFDQWALDSFPREVGITSKTQQHDDTIYLDLTSRPWLVPVVNLKAKARKRDEELFSFTIDASNLMPGRAQQTRHEACTAQTFTERRRGSPHFKALKGRTAVVLMDAGAPFAKALRLASWYTPVLWKLCECRRHATESADFVVNPRLLCLPRSH